MKIKPFLLLILMVVLQGCSILFGNKTAYIRNDIKPGNSMVIGGEGRASFTADIHNSSSHNLVLIKSYKGSNEKLLMLEGRGKVTVEIPENTELLIKNTNKRKVFVRVDVATSDGAVKAYFRPNNDLK